jgi:hypothetical protein
VTSPACTESLFGGTDVLGNRLDGPTWRHLRRVATEFLAAPVAPPPLSIAAGAVASCHGDWLRACATGTCIRFTDVDPYAGPDPMRADAASGRLYAYALGTPARGIPQEVNRRFRAAHDLFTHCSSARPGFDFPGELAAARMHAATCPALADWYASEVLGQAAVYLYTGEYPEQRYVPGAAAWLNF